MGYHNHNDSNYMICKEYYYRSWNGSYDEYMFDFAYGYMKGYEQYVRDGETLRIVYIRNGSL